MTWNDKQLIIDPPKKPKKITGTKLASILGLNEYTSPFAIWCEITHTYESPFEDSIFTIAGKTIEPKQAEYVKQYFKNVTTPTEKYGDNYFASTHGDFFHEDELFGGMWDYLEIENDTVQAVFEMKTAGAKKRALWENDIPEYYAIQAALYAYLLGVDTVRMVATFLQWKDYQDPNLFVPNRDNTIIVEFKLSERYPNFKEDYLQPAQEWYNKYVLTGISPEYEDRDLELVNILKEQDDMANIPEVDVVMKTVENDVSYLQEITDKVVLSYTEALDRIMGEVHDKIVEIDNPPISMIEKYFLELSNCVYFMSERAEKIGIYDSISKALAQEVYNTTYLDHQQSNVGVVGGKKPTVAESTAVAENKAKYENMTNQVYSTTYKIIKNKIAAAQTMIATLSKVMSSRMSEAQFNAMQSNKRTLLEDQESVF